MTWWYICSEFFKQKVPNDIQVLVVIEVLVNKGVILYYHKQTSGFVISCDSSEDWRLIKGGQRKDQAAGVNPAEEKLVYVQEIVHLVGIYLRALSSAGDCSYP